MFVCDPRLGPCGITPLAASVVMEEILYALLTQVCWTIALVLGIENWVRQNNEILFNCTLQVAKDQITIAMVIGKMAQALQSFRPFTCSLPSTV